MAPSVKVWDLSVRLFHWALVASFAVAWLTAEEWDALHEWAGYAVGGLVVLRIVIGFAGSHYARFAQFVRGPRETLGYAAAFLSGRETRYVGHNPLGAVMVLALLAVLAATGLTGWLQTTDAYWGVSWVEEVHEILGNGMLVLVAAHVGGVALASFRHKENLIRAMVTGRKRSAAQGDVT